MKSIQRLRSWVVPERPFNNLAPVPSDLLSLNVKILTPLESLKHPTMRVKNSKAFIVPYSASRTSLEGTKEGAQEKEGQRDKRIRDEKEREEEKENGVQEKRKREQVR